MVNHGQIQPIDGSQKGGQLVLCITPKGTWVNWSNPDNFVKYVCTMMDCSVNPHIIYPYPT
jgi:hypothetical protein